MKIAIVGASYLQLPLYIKAKELGFSTIGFAWLEGAVAKDSCEKFYPISIIEKENILSVCIDEKIDGILTIASDIAVNTVNFVASKMSLTGNSIESGLYSTNKYIMRQRLQIAGLNCPKFFPINKLEDIYEIGLLLHYPAIIKPVDRSGSKGVTKVSNFRELETATINALEISLSNQAILEEFVEGCEISVETISYKGIHYGITITDKVTSGPPHFVELAHHQPSNLSVDIQDSIFEMVHHALDALEIYNGASHSEFIISDKGIFVTEIGARMGGDFIGSDLVKLSTGYDFLKGVIQLAVGKFEIPVKEFQKFSGVYFFTELTPKVGEIIRNELYKDIVHNSEIASNILVPLTQSADRSGYFIYQNTEKLII
jgi:biotin carboxylase